jgi:hypothetical protein
MLQKLPHRDRRGELQARASPLDFAKSNLAAEAGDLGKSLITGEHLTW